MRRALAALALSASFACTACVPQDLAFRVDERVTITSPDEDAKVSLPFTLRWDVTDFDVVELGSPVRDSEGLFAVFIDSPAVGPGEGLSSVAEGDSACDASRGCPDARYYAERGIYATSETQLVVTMLPDDDDVHTATIVLLDASGKRIGESQFSVDFEVRGDQS